MILGLTLSGAGGRGWVTPRSENLEEETPCLLKEGPANLKASPLPPAPPAIQLLVTGSIVRIGRTDRPGAIVRVLDRCRFGTHTPQF